MGRVEEAAAASSQLVICIRGLDVEYNTDIANVPHGNEVYMRGACRVVCHDELQKVMKMCMRTWCGFNRKGNRLFCGWLHERMECRCMDAESNKDVHENSV